MRFEFIYKNYVDDQDYTSNNYCIRKMFPINIKVLKKIHTTLTVNIAIQEQLVF